MFSLFDPTPKPSYVKPDDCPRCDGWGRIKTFHGNYTCKTCGGSGKIRKSK
jgi:DnaJ-class molecular chaperone